MRHLKLALVVTFIILCSLACTDATQTGQSNTQNANRTATATTPTPAPATPTPDEFAEARQTYSATCVRCHKENGEGGVAELDEGETLKVPSFKGGHAVKHSDKDLARTIANGEEGMPAFKKRLTPEQIDGLVRLIRHDFQKGLVGEGGSTPASNSANTQSAH